MSKKISKKIIKRINEAGARYWANDNISEFIKDGEIPLLVDELTEAFEQALDSLIIDRATDPNSNETGRRIAKMYLLETMAGRYTKKPKATAFPNTGIDKYDGMLVIRAEIFSMCSHHHQPVTGTAYIGILPDKEVIGLSKYVRIAQWCARRGTLQEDLSKGIAKEIQKAAKTVDVAVHVAAEHGCCTNRGINAHSSLTQTTVVHGRFRMDKSVKAEFFDNIKMQIENCPS